MKRKFQPGLIYVFSYKKYRRFYRELGFKPVNLAKQLNGRVVDVINSKGRIDTFSIHPAWCKCIRKEDKLC